MPSLANVARVFLATLAMSVPRETVFSAADYIVSSSEVAYLQKTLIGLSSLTSMDKN